MQQGHLHPHPRRRHRRRARLRRASGALRRIASGTLDARRGEHAGASSTGCDEAALDARLLPPDALVAAWPRVVLSDDDAGRFLAGVRRRLDLDDAPAVRVYGPERGAFLGTGHVVGGELIASRLLSPAEVGDLVAAQRQPSVRFRKPFRMTRQIRNIAIIAHVDHGKTTLVDQLLRQSGTFRANEKVAERVMDSNDLERERGITILAKNCAVEWKGTHVNIVDTPGHADFGGEVERVLSMVDSVLLLVDAVEGPMPQTRFVTKKALALGLKPIVVVNKVDRPGAREDYVVNATFDLFDKLGASEAAARLPGRLRLGPERLGDAREGRHRHRPGAALRRRSCEHVPAHEGSPDDPLQLQICSLDYSTYVGRIGIGRINQGTLKPMQDVAVYSGPDSTPIKARVNQVLKFEGLERQQATEAGPGDIVLINGIEGIGVGVTLTSLEDPKPLPMLVVDEPTLTMNFCVNNSPLAGREGKFITSRQIRDRLDRELQSNVALQGRATPTRTASSRSWAAASCT